MQIMNDLILLKYWVLNYSHLHDYQSIDTVLRQQFYVYQCAVIALLCKTL